MILLAKNDPLCELVGKKLKEDWSPQQISGWLAKHCPDDEEMRVSHETIYRTLVRPDRRRAKTGAPCPSALQADDAPGPMRLHRRSAARADQGRRLDP
jgi:IS30 family transposase